jgi:hypothetical protein
MKWTEILTQVQILTGNRVFLGLMAAQPIEKQTYQHESTPKRSEGDMSDDTTQGDRNEQTLHDNERTQRALDEANESKKESEAAKKKTQDTVVEVGRRAFITAIVAIALNPVSALVGFYITHLLQRPRLSIEDIYTNTMVENHIFPDDALNTIRQDRQGVLSLKESIKRVGTNNAACVVWLDGKPWNDSCFSVVEEAANGLSDFLKVEIETTQANIKELENWSSSGNLNLRPTQSIDPQKIIVIGQANKDKTINLLRNMVSNLNGQLGTMSFIVDKLKAMDEITVTPRTGNIQLEIGILNDGEADGLVNRVGNLLYKQYKIQIFADDFMALKAHSFTRVKFTIPEEAQDKDAIAAWKGAVKRGEQEPYSVIINPDSEQVRSNGVTPMA